VSDPTPLSDTPEPGGTSATAAPDPAGDAAAAQPGHSAEDLPQTPPTGLSEADVVERRARGLGSSAPPPTTRTYTAIVRENVFTFVNNILFLMALALVVVGRPFDALVSLAVIGTNIVVGIVQEVRAKRTLDRIALLTRPTARVVRADQVREVGPEELVVGDLIAADAGDQIVVDGRLREGRMEVDESLLTGESDLVTKRPGDAVYSGSFAASGRGRYVAETVGGASLAGRITSGARTFRRTLTPLQRQIQGVIRVTLGIVIYLQLLLVVKNVLLGVPLDEAVIEATVLVGLIPNGLFVSIAIAYALAALRLSRVGALVQQANAVESLSHVDMLCVDKTGTLTANQLELEAILALDGDEAGARASVALMVASSSALNKTSQAIAAAMPSQGRAPTAEVPFSSARKWSAVSIPAGDGTGGPGGGTYAMGAPTFLQRYLVVSEEAWTEIQARVAEHAAQGKRVLLAACGPDTTNLRDEGDASVLPEGCRPYALIVLRDVLRRDAAETLERFRDLGVDVRVISGDDPDTVATLARQAGLDTSGGVISGPELEQLDAGQFALAAQRTSIFGRITPELKERLVGTFRDQGHYVAMTGDGVNDVLSLKRSNLAIAMGSGSQATRGVADLILIDDGFDALASAIGEGQRILNGMQDILRVFLTRILTLGLLIVSALVIGLFPVDLRNASVITLFTVGIPTALLAIWARPGRQPRETLQQTLARFVVPPAAVASFVGLLVAASVLLMADADATAGIIDQASVEPMARTAVTAFLVCVGLLVLVFVEPPRPWLAVIEPVAPDLRPTWLAIGLGIAFAVVMSVPAFRAFFNLQALGLREVVVVLVALAAWAVLVWIAWRGRFVDRFLGLAPRAVAADPPEDQGTGGT
jgi:cation-transporting P-type ATPase E